MELGDDAQQRGMAHGASYCSTVRSGSMALSSHCWTVVANDHRHRKRVPISPATTLFHAIQMLCAERGTAHYFQVFNQ